MKEWSTLFAPIVGRILVGGFFVWSGTEKALNIIDYGGFIAHAGYPWPFVWALLIVILEVMGGIALVADFEPHGAALVLGVYTLLSATLLFSASTTKDVQLFLQNMAILGGLLMVVAYNAPTVRRRR